MKVLGILVDEEGNYKTFGKWAKREERDINNCDHWHDDSFRNEISNTEWFNNMNLPYDRSKNFSNQLDVFAKSGKIVITNAMENEEEKDSIRLVITTPEEMTLEQINFLLEKKKYLQDFDKDNISVIDVFDRNEDYKIVQEFYDLKIFYKYLKHKLIEKFKKKNNKVKVKN